MGNDLIFSSALKILGEQFYNKWRCFEKHIQVIQKKTFQDKISSLDFTGHLGVHLKNSTQLLVIFFNLKNPLKPKLYIS